MITRKILDWTDEKFDEAIKGEKNWLLKAAVSGFVEGVVDGAVVMFPIVLGGCYYRRKKAQKK